MNKLIKFSVLLFSVLMLWSCSTDNDDEEISAEAATFDLILENNTGEEIEIFFKGSDPNAGFDRLGIIIPDNNFVISDVSVRQTYVVRASFVGDQVEGYFYEETINQTSPTDLTLTINQ